MNSSILDSRADTLPRGSGALAILLPVFAVLLLWAGLLLTSGALSKGPGGRSFGEDFDVYFAAAKVLHTGGNPYDAGLLYRSESGILHAQGLRVVEPRALVRVASPPIMFWAMEPITLLPFRLAVLAWVLGMLALVIAGFLAALRASGWRRWLLPLLFCLLLPSVDQGVLYGEITSIYFAAIGLALAGGQRHPYLAGGLLSVCWIKPPIAIPLAMVLLLFCVPQRRKALVGFVGASTCLAAFMLLTCGWNGILHWKQGLLAFSQGVTAQPGLVSLAGFYVKWTSPNLRTVLEVATALLAVGCTVAVWRRMGTGHATALSVACLWSVWMLGAPYGHFPDEMLLAIPALWLLGRDARYITSVPSILVLYLGAFSLWFNLGGKLPVQLTPAVPLLFLTCLVFRHQLGYPRPFSVSAAPGTETSPRARVGAGNFYHFEETL